MSGFRSVHYQPQGVVAVSPAALGMMFSLPAIQQAPRQIGPLAVIDIVGPLVHHAGPLFDSYDGIKSRAVMAFSSQASAVLLSLDSDGGDVDGMLDTASELRAMSLASGKPLYLYVDAKSHSAAYALGVSAERIYCPASGSVGSIGAYALLCDESKLDAAMGRNYRIVSSGSHKGDANPHFPLTETAIAERQKYVDTVGALFANWVAERRGIPAATVLGLDGRSLQAQEALAVGLVDEIATFDETVERITAELGAKSQNAPTGEKGSNEMDRKALVAALKALAEEGDEKAKKALVAFDEEPEEKKPDGDGDEKAAAEPGPKEEPKHAEPDGDEPKASAKTASVGASSLSGRMDRFETEALLAKRPDLPESFRNQLSARSPGDVKALLEATPVFARATPVSDARAAMQPTAQAATQAAEPVAVPRTQEEIDIATAMGELPTMPIVEQKANGIVFRLGDRERMREAATNFFAKSSNTGVKA